MMASSGSMSGVTTASSDEWYRSNKVSTAKTLQLHRQLSAGSGSFPGTGKARQIFMIRHPLELEFYLNCSCVLKNSFQSWNVQNKIWDKIGTHSQLFYTAKHKPYSPKTVP